MNKEILNKLLNLPGLSGGEKLISSFVKEQLINLGFEIGLDNMGSIWGLKKSSNINAKTLLIDAHMDEVGFRVTQLNERGFLNFEIFGGISISTLKTLRVKVWNKNLTKFYSGVILFPMTNPFSDFSKIPDEEEMLIDVGAKNIDELKKMGIDLGSQITFDTEVTFNENRVIAKSVDNRAGLSIMLEIAKYISTKEFDYNIIIGGSTQEEVGLRGARTFAYKTKPDLAIVIDISPSFDIPTGKIPYGLLGEGTMLRHKDAMTIYPKKIIEYLREIMINNNIKYQDFFSMGGTNAGVIHIWEEGRPVLPIGFVARLLHTGSTIFDINDYDETLKLGKLILNNLSNDKIVKFNK